MSSEISNPSPIQKEIQHIKEILATDKNKLLGECTTELINTMERGQHLSYKDFVDQIMTKFKKYPNSDQSITTGYVTNFVHSFVKSSSEVTSEKGRKGGVYKGGKMARIDKRPRCHTCNQVLRPVKSSSENLESFLQLEEESHSTTESNSDLDQAS